jgi:hypothetical protein
MNETSERGSNSSPLASRSARALCIAALVLAALLAARNLYRSPYSASDLHVTPDEVEYAVCARRLATLGHYDLDIDGVSTPPHSTPWFSALLAPVYLAAPDEVGNGIWVVFAFAVAGVIAVMLTGNIVSGPLGGALAVIAVLALPPYPYIARLIMTDGPAMVLGLVGLWLFVRWSAHAARVRESLIGGVLVASAFAVRSPYWSMILPFAWRAFRAQERRIAHFSALLAPLALVLLANAVYNQTTFGDWHRTGYQYWCAVPYDYPDLVLSLSNFGANFENLMIPATVKALALGAVGAVALVLRRPPRWKALLGYCAVTAVPISALHLVYFYATPRFHVYLIAACLAVGGIGLSSLLPARWREDRLAAVGAVALLAIAFFAMQPFDIQPPARRQAADEIQRETPADAVIISGLEPVYLSAFAPPGSQRTYVAASRDVEFASKVLSRARIDRELAAPRSARDHAASGLLAHGGRWAVPHTADEMHEEIEAWIRAGRAVFLETRFLTNPAAVQRMLGSSLRLEQPGAPLTRVIAAK